MPNVESPTTPTETEKVAESVYFLAPIDLNRFASHWSATTSLDYSDFIQKSGALACLELSHAWLTHCSIKDAGQRRDFSSQLISKFEKFLSLGLHERSAVYCFLLDAAHGSSRTNRLCDFRTAWENSTEEEKKSAHINKLGWAAERYQKYAYKFFYPIHRDIGGESASGRFLEFVTSEDDFEAYLKYMMMGVFLDLFDMEKAFQVFEDVRVRRLGVDFDIIAMFTLAKRLLAIGWRDEAIFVTEFSTNYAFGERMNLPFVAGEAEKLRKLSIGGRVPTVKPSHPIQFENIKRLSRR
jgi:hypothetical protein